MLYSNFLRRINSNIYGRGLLYVSTYAAHEQGKFTKNTDLKCTIGYDECNCWFEKDAGNCAKVVARNPLDVILSREFIKE